MRSIGDWFLRLFDKLAAWCIPGWMLTHKAKIRRLIALEEKKTKLETLPIGTTKVKAEGIRENSIDLIANADHQTSSQPSASY